MFYKWAAFVVLNIFGLYVLYNQGIAQQILVEDTSYVSAICLGLWAFLTALIGWKCSQQDKALHRENFYTSLLPVLGLFGTILGMREALLGFENLDADALQTAMQQVTSGVAVALWTTIVGLITYTSLKIQMRINFDG